MGDLVSALRDTPGATGVLILMLGVSLLGLQMAPGLIERCLLRPYWLLRQREYSTLISNGFVHADLAHLLFNAFTFWAFAFTLESSIGTPRFLALYAFGLLAGDLGTWRRHRHEPEYRSLGASGAILALLFASIVYRPTSGIYVMPIPVPVPAPLFALGYLAYTYYASRQSHGRINHDAHLGGALAGIAFVALTDPGAFGRALRIVFG